MGLQSQLMRRPLERRTRNCDYDSNDKNISLLTNSMPAQTLQPERLAKPLPDSQFSLPTEARLVEAGSSATRELLP
jgi:hypothetical protein